LRRFAQQLLTREGVREGDVNLVFVDDAYIQQLNQQFLGIDSPTDVLSFPLDQHGNHLEGEVYISVDTAAEQAREYNVSLREEILRLVAHGLLHLIGYDDRTAEEKERMTRKEEEYLALYQDEVAAATRS
jgi:rRNA maturation RNase YbeY